MAKLNLGTKVENGGTTAAGRVTATEINAIQASINSLYDFLFENGLIGAGITLKPGILPEATLSPDQFETLQDGHIGLIGFDNIGTGGGGSSLPKPAAPTVVFDTVGRLLSFTHTEYPDDIEYRINGGVWLTYAGGSTINVGTGAIGANYYQARVKAIPDETQAGNIAGNNYIAAVGGDSNLIAGYTYLDLAVLTGSAFPTPPLLPTNNTWKISGDGFGQGQPGKRFPVGGHIAFQYKADSANTKMCINWVAGSLGNYKAFEIEVTGAGVVKVLNARQSVDEVLTVQPTNGQYVNLTRVSGATSPSIFEVQILGTDGLTVIHSKQYTVNNTPVSDSGVEYDTAGGTAVINKPQGKNLTNV